MQNMKKHKRKIILAFLFVIGMCNVYVINAHAATMHASVAADMAQFDGVTVSPDLQAWTTEYKNKNIIQVQQEYTVYTGVSSTLPILQTGEHFYRAEAEGAVAIQKWVVQWSGAQCIHSFDAQNYHGFETESGICERYYHSGWFAYCAACEEPVTEAYIYASVDTVQGITSMPAQSNYLYICPFCNGLEQGISYTHFCKKVSSNYYSVAYDANAPEGACVKGNMVDTKHMYNNAKLYEGKPASAFGYSETKLRKNSYACEGYVFTGWSQYANGMGNFYKDEAEVLNLCKEEGGVITLYAQWEPAASTLLIDANGGTYLGREIYSVTGIYGTTFELKTENLTTPEGFLVHFETNGGEEIVPLKTKSEFAFWETQGELDGKLEGDIYTFLGGENTVDAIKACYEGGTIILPDCQKENELLVGWYMDKSLSQESFLGKAGEEVFLEEAATLYAKWSALSLWSEDNYVAHGGKGAVDLWWQQKDSEKLYYKLYQSKDAQSWEAMADQSTTGEEVCIADTFDATTQAKVVRIPWNGYYKLSAFGAKGADYQGISGSKGGCVEAEYWLEDGDMIRAYSGEMGQDDLTTRIYLLCDDTEYELLTAGGGSGTDLVESQTTLLNPAIEDVAFRSNITNMFPSGTGVYVVFNSQSEYPTQKISGEDWAKATGTVQIGGLNQTLETLRMHYVQDAYGVVDMWGENIQATAKENQPAFWGARQTRGGFSRTFVATYLTNGNTNLVVSGAIESWSGNVDGHIRFRILNAKTEEVLYDVTKVSGFSDWDGNVLVSKVLTWEDFDVSGIDEVTVEVYIKQVSGDGAATKVILYDTFFYGKTIYETVARPTGTNYINTAFGCKNPKSMTEVNDGDGYALLESVDVGYLDEFNINGVYAPDKLAPEKIANYKIKKTSETEVQVDVSPPQDRGTTYYHKVESFRFVDGNSQNVSTSNITQNILTTGVRGYYYYLDENPIGHVTNSHTFICESVWNIVVKNWDGYVHIAPIDIAGNLGETTDISLRDFINQGIFTLEARVYKARNPEEEVFKMGEGGVLEIIAGEYVERIEVAFPDEWLINTPDMNAEFIYSKPKLRAEECVRFAVPFGIANHQYEIKVTAYKGEEKLECNPVLIVTEGSVLDELHTRIRNNG